MIKKGHHTIPILVPIPSHGTIPSNPQSDFPLPPTFSERASPAYISYQVRKDIAIVACSYLVFCMQVSVSLKKGGFTPNRKLASSIAYLPRKIAGRPSPMRALAYEKGITLPGPSEDPAGWSVLHPVTVEGKLYDDRSVSVEYTVRLCTPKRLRH